MQSLQGFFSRLIPLLSHPPISSLANSEGANTKQFFVNKCYELPSFELILMYCTGVVHSTFGKFDLKQFVFQYYLTGY